MKVKILDHSLIINTIENSIMEWNYIYGRYSKDNGDVSGVIMSHKTYYGLMVGMSKLSSDYSFQSIFNILPNGRVKILNLDVLRTNDIDDDTLIFY